MADIHQHELGGPACTQEHREPTIERGALARAAALAAGREDWMDVGYVVWGYLPDARP